MGRLLSGDIAIVPEPRAAKVSQIRPSGRLRFADGSRPGFKGLLRQVGARGLTTFYRRMLFMSYQLDGPEIPIYTPSVPVEYAELQSSDLDAYLRFRPTGDINDLRERLAFGHRCFVCWHDGEIVDACWAATSGSAPATGVAAGSPRCHH